MADVWSKTAGASTKKDKRERIASWWSTHVIPASEGEVPHLPTEDVYTAILDYSLKPNLHSIKHSGPGPGMFLGLTREEVDAQHARGESRARATVISTTDAEAMSETRDTSRHELN